LRPVVQPALEKREQNAEDAKNQSIIKNKAVNQESSRQRKEQQAKGISGVFVSDAEPAD
jgi:hypothetical protein